ncbi:FecR family protein [Draconibacterium sp.]|uniref:FecR family protein n=1 Tax=Draconibacterium sp. TaxID=1965318 RepID=UPI003564DB1B
MIIDDIYISLVIRYLKKELSEEGKKELFHWVYEKKENEKLFYHLKDIWETAQFENISKGADTNSEWERLAMVAIHEETDHFYEKKSVKHTLYQVLKVAAVVLVTFGIGFMVQKYLPEEEQYACVNVPYGAKSELQLPDGSMIWVNSGSTLKYPTDVSGKEVNIYLDGEAFFDIAKNPKRALNVKTSSINIQVHGTSFNVKSYANDDVVETTLIEGLVSISGKVGNRVIKSPIFLKPNEQAVIAKSNETVNVTTPSEESTTEETAQNQMSTPLTTIQPKIEITKGIEPDEFIMWKYNVLVFKNERFEDLAIKLERWYNVQITIADKDLKNSRYTGTFEKESIEQAMKALSLSLPFKYEIDKNKITILKK